jgi:hypothetical protein
MLSEEGAYVGPRDPRPVREELERLRTSASAGDALEAVLLRSAYAERTGTAADLPWPAGPPWGGERLRAGRDARAALRDAARARDALRAADGADGVLLAMATLTDAAARLRTALDLIWEPDV